MGEDGDKKPRHLTKDRSRGPLSLETGLSALWWYLGLSNKLHKWHFREIYSEQRRVQREAHIPNSTPERPKQQLRFPILWKKLRKARGMASVSHFTFPNPKGYALKNRLKD